MKKETIFKHEINESIQANAALNCLKNRNTPKKLNETSDFDARFEFRKDLRELASPVAKKAYMIIRKQYGDSMWRRLYMDDCDERGLIDMLNMYAEKGLNPQQIVNKMLGVREDEEEDVDLFDLAVEIAQKNANKIARMSELNAVSILMRELCKMTNRDYDTLDEESDFDKYRDAAAYGYYSVVSYDDEEEEYDMTPSYQAYYSQDEPDYENDHHGIWLIINLMRSQGLLRAQGIEGRDDVDDGHAIDKAYDLIEQKLNEEGMWIGDDDNEAARFVSFFGEEIAAEAMKSALHNQQSQEQEELTVQQEETSLDTEWFTDLEEQEAYYENFRVIAELVADQIDRENGKGIDNNMDTLFEIIREVWNNNPDDLYIWDFDDVQEDDCYKFFDKHYEEIKNEYLKREHNNIMDATHDDLFDGMMNN